ncbi:anti-sigma regulatory factor (Ser/Thr protein kinase) [Candidatus Methanoperedens nitroreducens]|uniref:Anti-sigma regulatory factor (Ser/Thr protein kinase) n=2 Tax=Candidatus Methanoperedens nitratireducens TaxID=1392998 RepID=A0A062VBS5_9EURY|nr:anti-sigma regulatory factor (Ser/Thr protein kinase) [Candidatus Methanoperedens nitroreducens]
MRPMSEDTLSIRDDNDIISVRRFGRNIAARLGFGVVDQCRITTAISELARNTVVHGGGGIVTIRTVENDKKGIEIICRDEGPGIENLELALQGGYSTVGGFGIGLLGTKRLMDEFQITSGAGKGTTVIIRKWLK